MLNDKRFELEQKIMGCWSVVEDLGDDNLDKETLKKYYAAKFESLWETFEEHVACITQR